MKGMKHKLLTTKEVGERMGFKSRTISRWCREGKLDAVKVGRVWRISQHEVGVLCQRLANPR